MVTVKDVVAVLPFESTAVQVTLVAAIGNSEFEVSPPADAHNPRDIRTILVNGGRSRPTHNCAGSVCFVIHHYVKNR